MSTNRISTGSENASASTNGESQQDTAGIDAVSAQAETLKRTLREAHSQLGELTSLVKRYRKQNKLFRSTLASLRQLQTLET